MRKLPSIMAVLAGLFLLMTPLAVLAQTDPTSVINTFGTSFNAGNASAATALFTSDATVTWTPVDSGPGNISGMAGVQDWLQGEIKDGDKIQLSNATGTGNNASFTVRITMPELQQQAGIDYLEYQAVCTLSGGKFKSIAFTATPDTLAKFAKLGPPPGASNQGQGGQGGTAPGVPQTGGGGAAVASTAAGVGNSTSDLITTYWPWAAGIVGLVVVIGLVSFLLAKTRNGARPR